MGLPPSGLAITRVSLKLVVLVGLNVRKAREGGLELLTSES